MELFKLLGTIAIDGADQAKKEIDGVSSYTKTASEKIGGAVKAVGGVAVALGKATVVGVGAVATGLATMSKSAIESYADYEQLVGGVETLFKESAGKVIDYADQAYKTAGLSSNEYMETVTSFSASLLQSLGGDTEKATEYANQAIIDMSDNANKMGSDMSTIQSAYQGFAKQNYSMLDNLKLGYGGTGAEMYRLLEDASKLNEEFAKTANFSIDSSGHLEASYADITQAIHIVQTEMGITGTTAEEAEKTISGSLASMKSQWQNLLTAIANGDDWDIGIFIDNFIKTVENAVDNIYPIFEKSLVGIGEMISTLSPIIAEKLPELIQKLLPPLIESATQLVVEFAKNLPSILSTLGSSLAEALDSIFSSVFGTEEGKVKEIIEKIIGAFQSVVDWITKHKALVEGLAIAIGAITTAIVIVNGVIAIATGVMTAFGTVMAIVTSPITLVVVAIGALIAIGVLLYKNWDVIKEKAQQLGNFISEKWNAIKEKTSEAFNKVKETMSNAMNSAKEYVSGKLDAIKKKYEENGGGIKGVVSAGMEAIKQYYSVGYDAINKLTGGKLDEVKKKFTDAFDKVKETVSKAIEKIKGFFNFEWKLPDLKMPHFKIDGSFSLNPPSVPKIGIDWYAKAMNDPMIMNQPTAFGINANGQIMAGGEAGSEIVSGTNTLMNMISTAVQAQNQGLEDKLSGILEMMSVYMPQMANMQMVVDSGALVGQIAPSMDSALGKLAIRNGRMA